MVLILLAERRAIIKTKTSAAVDDILKILVRNVVGGEIEPEEVCSLGLRDLDGREEIAEIIADILGVVGDVGEKFAKPRLTVFVCRLKSETTEHVILEMEDSLSIGIALAEIGIRSYHIRGRESGDVERLGCCHESDAIVGEFRRY